jgi:rod shape-determining protein MreD
MKPRILKALNLPGLLLFALLVMSLQSTLFNSVSLAFFQPDIILFLVLWVAMKRDFEEGGFLTLILGYLVELKSGSPRGLFLLHYMILYLVTRFLYRNFQVLNRRSLVLIGVGASLISRLNVLFLMYLLNKAENLWFHTLQLLAPTAIIHGVLIPFVFRFLHRFDLWTFKNPEAEHRYERDFYLDEEPI